MKINNKTSRFKPILLDKYRLKIGKKVTNTQQVLYLLAQMKIM